MKLILLLALSLVATVEAYASEDVYITDIKIIPNNPKINDTIALEATVVNNSFNTIAYPSLCDSPLDANFSNNIVTEFGIACLGFGIEVLEPFQNATVRGPASGIFYKVIDYGLTRANITFTYLIDDIKESVSKELSFIISNDTRSVNKEFFMRINQTVKYNDLEITLIDILEDSRCPIDVTCFWEGDAKALLSIKKDFIDNFNVTLHEPLIIDNIAINLESLKPDRRSNDIIEKDKYQAKFVISEPKESMKFKAYNDDIGMLGVLDLDNNQGFVIMFDEKRTILEFNMDYDKCNRLSALCFNANNKHIEIGRDFMLIDKAYIPTIDLKLI
ncbi:MAG: hypothetical protein KatS3mg003_1092 [Candidatus Nitrosocaldaceae archaeon]|nr:MAG: hypothetical protein KatS3mg003_1092 [Candidatus Nitrosocaldaceae archaeon]